MHSRGRVFGVSVWQFVCLFIRHFLGWLCVLDLFEVSFSSLKMALVNKLAFLCPAFKSNHSEALKSMFSCHLDASKINIAFSTNDQFQFNRHLLAWWLLPLSTIQYRIAGNFRGAKLSVFWSPCTKILPTNTWATPISEATCRQLPWKYYPQNHSFADYCWYYPGRRRFWRTSDQGWWCSGVSHWWHYLL